MNRNHTRIIQSIDIPNALWNEILLIFREAENFEELIVLPDKRRRTKSKKQNQERKTYDERYDNAIGYYFQGKTFYQVAVHDNDYVFPLNLFYSYNNLVKACIFMKTNIEKCDTHGAAFKPVYGKESIDYSKSYFTFSEGVFLNLISILPYMSFEVNQLKTMRRRRKRVLLKDVLERLYYISTLSLPQKTFIRLKNTYRYKTLYRSSILKGNAEQKGNDSPEHPIQKFELSDAHKNMFQSLEERHSFLHDKFSIAPSNGLVYTATPESMLYLESDNYGHFYLVPGINNQFFEQLALLYLLSLAASTIVRYHGDLWNSILRDKKNIESGAFVILLKDLFYSFPLKVLDLLTGRNYYLR